VAASFRVREGSPDPGGLPRYPIKALILVCFVLLLLQSVSQIVKQVDVIRGAAEDELDQDAEPEVPA
jgi:TRAP-type mannitol/chloroaromatic compound transport system permease small subunit